MEFTDKGLFRLILNLSGVSHDSTGILFYISKLQQISNAAKGDEIGNSH